MPTFSFNLIDQAHAQAAGGPAGFDFMGLAPLVVIFIAFYFFLIRPQQKKAQQQRDMLSSLAKGDRVVTVGGIIAKVHSLENEMEVVVEVEDGVRMRLLKSAIVEMIPSGSSAKISAIAKAEGDVAGKTKPARPAPKKSSKDQTIN